MIAAVSGQARLDDILVEPACRLGRQQVGKNLHGGVLGVGAGRDVVRRHGKLEVAYPAQRDGTFAVLGGLGGVRLEELVGPRAVGARDDAELLLDDLDCPCGLEAAGDDEHGVVRLVVLAVEGLQPVDGHVLDVGAGTDRGVAVVVPEVGRRRDAGLQDADRVVLAALHLVTNHSHLGVEVVLGDEGIDHPVGFEVERPDQVVVVRREGLEVVGAVEPSRAIREGTAFGQFGGNVRMVGRPLEQQMLEEVGHARLAVALVARPHEVCDVHRDLLLALVREQQEAQAVGKPVLRDALDGGHLRGPGGLLGEGDEGRQAQHQGNEHGACRSDCNVRSHLSSKYQKR